jgi:hypothetical protein
MQSVAAMTGLKDASTVTGAAELEVYDAATDAHGGEVIAGSAESGSEMNEEMVMQTLATLKNVETGILISVLDFGGQSAFHVIHHLFLTRDGTYDLVFNLEWLVSDVSEKEKALQFIRSWMSSIAVHTYDKATAMCAPIVLVGSRLDKVHTPAQREQISTLLQANELLHANGIDPSGVLAPYAVSGIVNGLLQFLLCKASENDSSTLVEAVASKVVNLLEDCVANVDQQQLDLAGSGSALRPLADLTLEEVGPLLASIGFANVTEVFISNSVTGQSVTALTTS